jgi:hypothetical protein
VHCAAAGIALLVALQQLPVMVLVLSVANAVGALSMSSAIRRTDELLGLAPRQTEAADIEGLDSINDCNPLGT